MKSKQLLSNEAPLAGGKSFPGGKLFSSTSQAKTRLRAHTEAEPAPTGASRGSVRPAYRSHVGATLGREWASDPGFPVRVVSGRMVGFEGKRANREVLHSSSRLGDRKRSSIRRYHCVCTNAVPRSNNRILHQSRPRSVPDQRMRRDGQQHAVTDSFKHDHIHKGALPVTSPHFGQSSPTRLRAAHD